MYGMCHTERNGVMLMKCLICGRRLRNTQSKELGYGPVCYKRKFGVSQHADRRDGSPSVDKAPDFNLPGQISMFDYLQMVSGQ